MSALDHFVPPYAQVFARYMMAGGELAREESLFEATEVGKAMLAEAEPAVDQILELHRVAQRGLAARWTAPQAAAAEREAGHRLAEGEAMPLMLALMLPHDLALRAHHEQRWRAEHGKVGALFEQTRELILLLDREGRIESVNPAFTRATGWSAPDADERFSGFWRRSLHGGGEQQLRGEQRRRDGGDITVDWSVTPILGRDAELLGHVCIGRDATRQAQIDASLRENDKLRAVATLAAGIAHDFNNLLGAINGLAELCALEAAPDSRQARNLQRIRQAGDKAAALVRQMLDFSRQTPPAAQRLRLGELLAHAEGLLRAALPPGVTLALQVDDDGEVLADLVQMEQVLMNIVRNAVQAMPPRGGAIRIQLDRAGPAHPPPGHAGQPQLRLRISDNGRGMDAELLTKIFDPFFTTKPVGEGTGLGLAAVHGIVASHGGLIEVASQPGRGSAFSLFLPLAAPAAGGDEAA